MPCAPYHLLPRPPNTLYMLGTPHTCLVLPCCPVLSLHSVWTAAAGFVNTVHPQSLTPSPSFTSSNPTTQPTDRPIDRPADRPADRPTDRQGPSPPMRKSNSVKTMATVAVADWVWLSQAREGNAAQERSLTIGRLEAGFYAPGSGWPNQVGLGAMPNGAATSTFFLDHAGRASQRPLLPPTCAVFRTC